MRLRVLPILAVLLAFVGAAVVAVSYPALTGLALVGAGIVFAILTLKE